MEEAQHELVPTHEKLSAKEKEELLKTHSITINELPRIPLSDPAIKHLEPEEGDVIKIIRTSPTAGKAIFYRGVSVD